jgi:hypothetical protein
VHVIKTSTAARQSLLDVYRPVLLDQKDALALLERITQFFGQDDIYEFRNKSVILHFGELPKYCEFSQNGLHILLLVKPRADELYCNFHPGYPFFGRDDFAKGALAEDFSKLVLLLYFIPVFI